MRTLPCKPHALLPLAISGRTYRITMELGAVVAWVVVGVVGAICVGAHVRQVCLRAHTASLRDRGEYKYTPVRQSAA